MCRGGERWICMFIGWRGRGREDQERGVLGWGVDLVIYLKSIERCCSCVTTSYPCLISTYSPLSGR